MALNEKDINIIDKYLRSRLTEEENRYIEERKGDSQFAKELLLKSDMSAVYGSLEMDEHKEKLQVLEAGLKTQKNPPVKSNNYLRWAIASLVVIATIILYFLLTKKDKPSVLYASYYKPYPNVVSPLDRSVDGNKDIYQLYESGDYSNALSQIDPDSSDENQQFYYALSLLGSGQANAAITALIAIGNSASRYKLASEWYLAMTYLKLKDEKSCITILNKIVNNMDHPFRSEAESLLEDL